MPEEKKSEISIEDLKKELEEVELKNENLLKENEDLKKELKKALKKNPKKKVKKLFMINNTTGEKTEVDKIRDIPGFSYESKEVEV